MQPDQQLLISVPSSKRKRYVGAPLVPVALLGRAAGDGDVWNGRLCATRDATENEIAQKTDALSRRPNA